MTTMSFSLKRELRAFVLVSAANTNRYRGPRTQADKDRSPFSDATSAVPRWHVRGTIHSCYT